jgi:hypothetical protein
MDDNDRSLGLVFMDSLCMIIGCSAAKMDLRVQRVVDDK